MRLGERKHFKQYENPQSHKKGPFIDTSPSSYFAWNRRNYEYVTYDRILAIELPSKSLVSFYYKGLTSDQKVSFYKHWREASQEEIERLQTYCEHGDVYNADQKGRRGRKAKYRITLSQSYTGSWFTMTPSEFMDDLEEVKPTQPPPIPPAPMESQAKPRPKSFFDSLFPKTDEAQTQTSEDLQFTPITPQKKLADIVGIPTSTMQEANELVEQISQYKDPKSKLRRRNAKLRAGFVFYGPVGTGKSSLAEAIAGETGATFAKIKIAGATSMWVGQSERILKRFFTDLKTEARKLSRENRVVIMLMDEITALLIDREKLAAGVDSSHNSRFVDAFNQEMDDLRNDKTITNVITIGTTNLPAVLDDAISRRFGPLLEIPLPTEDGRAETFAHYIGKYIRDANGKLKPTDPKYQYVFFKLLQETAMQYVLTKEKRDLQEFKKHLGTLIQDTWGFAQADIERVVDMAFSKSTLRPDTGTDEDLTTLKDLTSAVATQEQSKHIIQARTLLQEQGLRKNRRFLFPGEDDGPQDVYWNGENLQVA